MLGDEDAGSDPEMVQTCANFPAGMTAPTSPEASPPEASSPEASTTEASSPEASMLGAKPKAKAKSKHGKPKVSKKESKVAKKTAPKAKAAAKAKARAKVSAKKKVAKKNYAKAPRAREKDEVARKLHSAPRLLNYFAVTYSRFRFGKTYCLFCPCPFTTSGLLYRLVMRKG